MRLPIHKCWGAKLALALSEMPDGSPAVAACGHTLGQRHRLGEQDDHLPASALGCRSCGGAARRDICAAQRLLRNRYVRRILTRNRLLLKVKHFCRRMALTDNLTLIP
jgi:hypothetical protein